MPEPLTDAARWERLHERLAEFERRLSAGFAVTADESLARLRERTRHWADTPRLEPQQELEVLTFGLGNEQYAIGSEHVAQVLALNQYTPLPNTPGYVLGIVNVRGRIVSVVDLRVLLELPITGIGDRSFLLVLQSADMEFGLLIDRLLGVAQISRGSLQSGLGNLSGVRAKYLLGVTREQWTVLDGARLLGDSSLCVMAE